MSLFTETFNVEAKTLDVTQVKEKIKALPEAAPETKEKLLQEWALESGYATTAEDFAEVRGEADHAAVVAAAKAKLVEAEAAAVAADSAVDAARAAFEAAEAAAEAAE